MIKHDDLTQDVTTKASELGSDAKSAIRSEADRAAASVRDTAVEKARNVANAADAAAAEFDANSIQARAAQQVADQVESLANKLRSSDLATVTRDVSDFARKNPALFIGGAALLGFAATRFLKARDPQRIDYGSKSEDPWMSHPQHTGGFDVPS